MSRKLLTVAALAVCALPFAAARAQLGYGVSAGLSAPTGSFGNSVDAGYNVSGMLTFSAPLAPVGLRVEGSFNEFNYKSTILSGAKFRALSGTANAVFSSPGIMGPYLIGGLGIYDMSTSCSGCGSNSSSKFGFNGGGGFKFGLSGFSAFLEARYHHVSATGGSISFIPISFGVTF